MAISNTVHPFPARMAPDIVVRAIKNLPLGATVLDPMAGSGTVLRTSAGCGHPTFGFDLDPLAVLMAKVWTTKVDIEQVRAQAHTIIARAKELNHDEIFLEWIDNDLETSLFTKFWFAEPQRGDLRRLARVLSECDGEIGDVLKIALSRIIVTKNKGASLAGDVSHGKPHRIRTTNNFNVLVEFLRSVELLTKRLSTEQPVANVNIRRGDARNMEQVENNSIDAIVTSPPYLNAIDYMRGHKLSLVWLGYSVASLRMIKSESVGAFKKPSIHSNWGLGEILLNNACEIEKLPSAKQSAVLRYSCDVAELLSEAARVLIPGGKGVYVVGNSNISGVPVNNTKIVINAAHQFGLVMTDYYERELLASRRYLPPPKENFEGGAIQHRMGTECIVTFVKPA